MDVLSILLSIIVGLITLVVLYVFYMSRQYGIFRKMGVKALTPWPALGSFPTMTKLGVFEFHKTMYNKFHGEKMYGYFEASTPVLVIRDPDLLREIMVKNFNCFVNKRIFFKLQEPINHGLLALEDDHWRRVRSILSPTFTSGKLKKICVLVEGAAQCLTSNLHKTSQDDKEIDLKHVLGCYAMDVIAITGFGASIDTFNDRSNPFEREARKMMYYGETVFKIAILFPMLFKFISKLGYDFFPKSSFKFFNSFLDAALENKKSSGLDTGKKHNNFVEILADEEMKYETSGTQNKSSSGTSDQEKTGLSHLEVQGQSIIFILAAYDTVSSVLAFGIFTLAHKPDITRKLQQEIDEVLEGKPPTIDNINSLVYLEMCVNEVMRMYPAGYTLDRICRQECEIGGIMIPKGMMVLFPFIAIYNDPEHFPNPEEFDPERFTPENKARRHPFAFLPFGQGPRSCIAMRLGQAEVKIAMVSILQEMTPVPCSKSVYPPKLSMFQLHAEDGLWVKFEPRKQE